MKIPTRFEYYAGSRIRERAEIKRLNREQEYLEYMRSQGYELLDENTRAQNLFARVRWPNKES